MSFWQNGLSYTSNGSQQDKKLKWQTAVFYIQTTSVNGINRDVCLTNYLAVDKDNSFLEVVHLFLLQYVTEMSIVTMN